MSSAFIPRVAFLFGSALVCSVLAFGPGAAPARADDVKMFNAPPSPEELKKAMGIDGGGAPPPKVRTRGIYMIGGQGDAPAAAAPEPEAAAPATAAPEPSAAPARQAAAPAHRPQPPRAAQSGSGTVGFPIQFALGSAAIRQESFGFLESMGSVLRSTPDLRLVVEGHTDASGAYTKNVELSRARAEAVRDALVTRYGIDPARLQAVGKGPTEPRNPGNPYGAENRRVQFRPIAG